MCCTFTDNISVSKNPNFWKFINSVMTYSTFLEQMKLFIPDTVTDLANDNSVFDQINGNN